MSNQKIEVEWDGHGNHEKKSIGKNNSDGHILYQCECGIILTDAPNDDNTNLFKD